MSFEAIDLAATLEAWGVVASATRPAPAGDNNQTIFIDTAEQDYYLRFYPSTSPLDRVLYEHALLEALGGLSLPFETPQPMTAQSGESYVTLSSKPGLSIATLFRAIPGENPRRDDARVVEKAGEALALLDNALKGVTGLPEAGVQNSYGELNRVHPLAPDMKALVDMLPSEGKDRRRIGKLFDDLMDDTKDLYKDLPTQVIHGDFGPSNTLVRSGGIVSGVIDFDFASDDLRIMDLACGISTYSFLPRRAGAHWPTILAFVKGYMSRMRLAPDEVEALPTALRLREANVLIMRAGRWMEGIASETQVQEAVDKLLGLDDWLKENDDELTKFVTSNLRA